MATRTCPVALRGCCNTGRQIDPGGVTGSNARVARELAAQGVGRVSEGGFGPAVSDTCARRRWQSFAGDKHVLRDIDAVGVAAGKVGTYGGGASAFVFGLTANEFAALSGIVVGVLGLLVQWYFNRRRDRREQAEFEARMAALREALHEPLD